MARRHPQKGCSCLTCTNSRLYSRTQTRPADYDQKRRAKRTEAEHAIAMSQQRLRRRRAADRRDAARLDDLSRRAT